MKGPLETQELDTLDLSVLQSQKRLPHLKFGWALKILRSLFASLLLSKSSQPMWIPY